MTTVLVAKVPNRPERDAWGLSFWDTHSAKFAKYGWRVRVIECTTDAAYGEAILKQWNEGDDLIVHEPDVEPTEKALLSLEECRAPLCTIPYESHTWKDNPPGQHGWESPDPCSSGTCHPRTCVSTDGVWGAPVDGYEAFSGLGLVRFGMALQKRHPRPEWGTNIGWRALDGAVNTWLRYIKVPWHKHAFFLRHNATPPCRT